MEDVKVKTSKLRKFFVFIFMVAITMAVCGASYFIATKEYEITRGAILQRESENLSAWVDNTVSQIKLWTDSLNSQAKRVSTSELYRLFASDAASLTGEQVLFLNDESMGNTSSLSEQVPLMRSVLQDFMNLNGYTDARLLDSTGITLLSAQARPTPIDETQIDVARRSIEQNAPAFSPIVSYQSGLLLHFADPLKPVLNQGQSSAAIASLLLSTPVTSTLARFLAHDAQKETFSTYIVQKRQGNFEVIDLQSNFAPISDNFVEEGEDALLFKHRYSIHEKGGTVYSFGTYIPNLGWWVIAETPASIVLENLAKEKTKIYGFAITFTVGFMLVLALLWWIVVGREEKANAKRFESLFKLIEDQKRILDNVNAALDTGLLAADVTGKVIMANRAFGELCTCDYKSVAGENFAPLFDPTFTHELLSGISKAVQTAKPLTAEYSAILKNETRLLRLTFYPFLDNEVPETALRTAVNAPYDENPMGLVTESSTASSASSDARSQNDAELAEANQAEKSNRVKSAKNHRTHENAALITFTDITEFRRQSNAKRHVQEKSMQALVRAVESMDPYLSGHSRRMEQFGILVSKHLKLDENDLHTIAIGANLSQTGKLFVSRDLLLKQGALTLEEKAQLFSIPEKAWLILKEIDFHLPVPQAVHDMYERLDGKGYPRQLAAENIALHARVLGIVNTFCAMTAPRSYRKGINIDDALKFLREDKGYDQSIVDALEAVVRTPEGMQVALETPDASTIKI